MPELYMEQTREQDAKREREEKKKKKRENGIIRFRVETHYGNGRTNIPCPPPWRRSLSNAERYFLHDYAREVAVQPVRVNGDTQKRWVVFYSRSATESVLCECMLSLFRQVDALPIIHSWRQAGLTKLEREKAGSTCTLSIQHFTKIYLVYWSRSNCPYGAGPDTPRSNPL